jgi:hypothetical protein
VVRTIVAAVRSPNRSGRGRKRSAEAILAEQLASGDIEGKDYQHRLDLLRSSKAHLAIEVRRDSLQDRPIDHRTSRIPESLHNAIRAAPPGNGASCEEVIDSTEQLAVAPTALLGQYPPARRSASVRSRGFGLPRSEGV